MTTAEIGTIDDDVDLTKNPGNIAELHAQLNALSRGDFGTKRLELATENADAFEKLRKAEQGITFSAGGDLDAAPCKAHLLMIDDVKRILGARRSVGTKVWRTLTCK